MINKELYEFIQSKLSFDEINNLQSGFISHMKIIPPLNILSRPTLDIIGIDESFDKADPLYNSKKCTYDGISNISLQDYVLIKFGVDTFNALMKLLN